jgi:hypothetical protein
MPRIGNLFHLMFPHEGATNVIVTFWHSSHLRRVLKTLAVYLLSIEWNQFYLVITFQVSFGLF